MNKTQRLKQFLGIVLQEDIEEREPLSGLPVKETTVNLGLSILMVIVTTLHLALSLWQVAISLLLAGYDLIAKGLTKIMPAPKEAKAKEQA